jgi:hypothetical protein
MQGQAGSGKQIPLALAQSYHWLGADQLLDWVNRTLLVATVLQRIGHLIFK